MQNDPSLVSLKLNPTTGCRSGDCVTKSDDNDSEPKSLVMVDFLARRTTMVDTQIRPSDVTKFSVIEAMLNVPREAFVPGKQRDVAYVGEILDLGQGRAMLEPRNLAKMLDALDVQPDEMVLDVGSGLGYSAAVIARMAEAVVALEADEEMAAEAERILGETGADNVAVIQGALDIGAPKHGPYDVIVIAGGVQAVPQTIVDQLKEGGRIGTFFREGALGICRIGHKLGGNISWRYAFNGAAPVLPGFAVASEFAL